MKKYWNIFLRVLASYSLEEKVISIILAGIVIFLSIQGGSLKVTSLFNDDKSTYQEGLITDKPIILNPLFVDFNEANRDISRLLFSGLTKYDPQNKSFVGDLANIQISEDRKTYHFTLKNNLKWHDDKPVTTDDVLFTFHDLIQNPQFKNPILQANFQGIEIKKIDEKNIDFILKTPNAFFITNTSIGLVPKHLLQNVPIDQIPTHAFNSNPIGTGSYKIDSPLQIFDDGHQNVSLTAFNNYYDQKPQIKQIHFHVYPTFNDLKKELTTLNVIPKIPTGSQAELPPLFQVMNYELPQYNAIFLNLQRPIFTKDKMKIGLLKAIDKQELLKLLTDKIAVDTPLLELNQSEWIYKANLKEAQGALFDSGYKIDKSKNDPYRYDKQGQVLQMTLLVRNYDEGTLQFEENKKVIDFLITAWKEAGIKIQIDAADNDTYLTKIQNREYDMLLAGQGLGYNLDTYSYWHSTQATPSGLNLSNYKSFAADQLIEQIRDTFNAEEKEKYLKGLATVIASDIPAIFLYRPRYSLATNGKIKGINLENVAFTSDRFANIDKWCIEC